MEQLLKFDIPLQFLKLAICLKLQLFWETHYLHNKEIITLMCFYIINIISLECIFIFLLHDIYQRKQIKMIKHLSW